VRLSPPAVRLLDVESPRDKEATGTPDRGATEKGHPPGAID
jgi:hypothetical protein